MHVDWGLQRVPESSTTFSLPTSSRASATWDYVITSGADEAVMTSRRACNRRQMQVTDSPAGMTPRVSRSKRLEEARRLRSYCECCCRRTTMSASAQAS